MSTIHPMKKLTLSFLSAHHGPLVLPHLRKDKTCADVFSSEICALIQQKETLSPAENEAVIEAFIQKACPGFKDKPQILNWVLCQYKTHRHNNKPILAEDLYKINDSLNYFESLKKSETLKIQDRDLFSHKTYQSLLDVLKPFEQNKAAKESARLARFMSPEERQILKQETTVLYEGPPGKIVIPHTIASSQYWGNNTKWCISGTEAKTYFPRYNCSSPIIILIPRGRESDKIALVEKTLYNKRGQHDRRPAARASRPLARLSP